MNPSNDVLFSSDLWEKALAKFASAAHMTVKLFDADLRAVFGPIHPTPLFQLFDDKQYDTGLFAECVRRCLLQTEDRPAVIVSQIHGLAVVGTSLVLEGKIVGAAVGGYVLADFSQVSEVQRLARQAGIPFDRLWGVARQQQPVPQTRLIVLGELLQVLGDALLRENYRTRQYAETAAIVTSSDDAIVSEDLRGVVTSWNRGAEKLFGYTASEAVGRPLDATISSGHSSEEQAIRNRIKRGEIVEHYETRRRRKDGTSPLVSLTVSPVKDAQGRVVAVSTITRDITERKLAETALHHAMEFDEAVMANMGEGLYTVDTDGHVTTMNPAAERLLGWTFEELRGKKMHDVTHCRHPDGSAFPAEECPGFQVLRHGRTLVSQEDCFIRKDGTFFDVVYSSSPVREGDKVVGLVVVFRDVTDRKQAEKVLRESEERLARELAATQQLQAASALLIQAGSTDTLYQKIVGVAVAIMQSDMASMQIVDEDQGGLRMLAFQGFEPEFGKTFELNRWDTRTSCSMARRVGHRLVVPDVETCEFIVGTAALEDHRKTGIRAVQSTPLFSRDGRLLGMISTHWRVPHTPAESDLRQFDILARQAADLLERKQAEDALRRSHDELESMVEKRTASLRRLSNRLQHVQDEERRKMARDLHDSAGQYLAAVKMNLARLNQAGPSSAKATVEETEQLVDRCVAEIRTISYLLHPPMLDESGLASAVTWYVEGFAKRSNIQTELDISPPLERLPKDVEMVLFRALQESLTNVHRHSESLKVDVQIHVENDCAILVVRDYGRGLGPEQLESLSGGSGSGVGLAGMRERVNEVGGTLQIRLEKPGTSVRVALPIGKTQARPEQAMERPVEQGSAA